MSEQVKQLLEILKNLSPEEKVLIQSVITPPAKKQVNTRKKTAKKRTKHSLELFDDKIAATDPEVIKATAISKKIKTTKGAISQKRDKITFVKVKCPNCNRSYTVNSNLAKDFICCLKHKK